MSSGISAIGGYLPQLRLDRRALSRDMAWAALPMPRSGYRAVAGWDEDALTMAVEAARSLSMGSAPAALRFASTSAWFTDRAQSAIALDALHLPGCVRTSDAANSRRAATGALLDALLAGVDEIVMAGEHRPTRPGSAAQLSFGDGAAAVRTGHDAPARLVGHATITHDLVDRYTSRGQPFSYAYEERFVRDVSVDELVVPALRKACEMAGVEPAALAFVACAEPVSATWRAAARILGCKAPNVCERLSEIAGDLGAAQPLYGLGLALAAAKPGDLVAVLGCGSGVDALVFEVIAPVPGAAELEAALEEGEGLSNVSRFLSLSGSIDLDWGMRAEFEQKAQATALERVGRDMTGFVGGRDSLGAVQFPKSAIPLNPALSRPEPLEDVALSGEEGTIVSITADRLNFTPDPPFDFGLVQFDDRFGGGGARVLMEMVDRPAGGFAVGQRVRMRFRIKSMNSRLGFRTYFWKAAPVTRPRLGDA